MIVSLNVGGARRPWRLLEGHHLSAWIEEEPWLEQASTAVLHAPRRGADRLVAAIKGEVKRATRPGEYVRVDTLPPDICARAPRAALQAWMNIAGASPRRLAESLARISRTDARLLVALLPETASAGSWLEELQAILDIHSKLADPGELAVLVLTCGADVHPDAMRLDLAWPVSSGVAVDMDARWATYLHERVAWHAGGFIDRVDEVRATLDGIATGGDTTLEDALDAHGAALADGLPRKMREGLERDLARLQYHPWLLLPAGFAGLESRGMRPVPWLARGLLAHNPKHRHRRYLRSVMVCRPLANRLLGRAMEMEEHIRDRLLLRPPPGSPGEAAVATARRLSAPGAAGEIEHRLTPRGRQAEVTPWEVATLNTLINRGSRPPEIDAMHELRKVRNALAHGSEVGWNAIAIIEGLERTLAKGGGWRLT